uniref:Transket_pyr domain-containing protein n=1 Tax=Heterorhabditis bacteriophora TaxID=37862 RepID=A0A1I7WH21_HETBA
MLYYIDDLVAARKQRYSTIKLIYMKREGHSILERNEYYAEHRPMISGEVVTPMILIGLDLLPSGFLIQPTIFGNAVYGSGNLTDSAKTTNAHTTYPDLCKLLRSVYSLEGLGIREDPINKADETFQYMERYLKLVQFTQEGYEKILQSCINEGIIEVADDDIPQRATTFYLPHRGVWKPEKTTPLRIILIALIYKHSNILNMST